MYGLVQSVAVTQSEGRRMVKWQLSIQLNNMEASFRKSYFVTMARFGGCMQAPMNKTRLTCLTLRSMAICKIHNHTRLPVVRITKLDITACSPPAWTSAVAIGCPGQDPWTVFELPLPRATCLCGTHEKYSAFSQTEQVLSSDIVPIHGTEATSTNHVSELQFFVWNVPFFDGYRNLQSTVAIRSVI